MTRWLRRVGATILLAFGAVALAPGATALAHPLGNITVNHYDGLRLFPDRVEVLAVVDHAEIPTLQQRARLDADGDGAVSGAEAQRRAGAECVEIAGALDASVDGAPLAFAISRVALTQPAGEAGLVTTRVECSLAAPAALDRAASVSFADGYLGDRIGWREVTATGEGVRLLDSALPIASVSSELRAYPVDLLADPLDVRSVDLRVEPGAGGGSGGSPAAGSVVDQALGGLAAWFTELVGRVDPPAWVGPLAVVLALVLGASHALLPGHGKTVMAAYLAGRRGTRRDAVVVGATVTATHTAGVLALGLAVSVSSTLAPEGVLRWLGVGSGLLVAGIGAGLMRSAVRPRRALVYAGFDDHEAGHGHGHGHSHGHSHGPRFGRGALVGLGVAGGLVPSPTALVVLLGAIGLGRTWFGVVLVLAYGLGMAATLTAAGLLLVGLRDRLERLPLAGGLRDRVAALTPLLTSALVLIVGVGLALRSLAGIA